MSSVSVSYSDLDARTDFVLNRVAFLQSVPGVMEHEHTPENKQKVAVWRDNNYIPLIVRSIMDPNEEIYDHAIWATGNLLGSDDAEVAAKTRAAITDDLLKRLVQMAGRISLSPGVQNGIYYLFWNLSQADYEMPRFFTEAIGNSLLRTMLREKVIDVVNPKARIDFLETVKNIAKKDPRVINALLLTEALLNPDQSRNHSRLFHIIGTLAEHDSMIRPVSITQLMSYFSKQLSASADNTGITRQEMLWVLSNIMTEPTAPAFFMCDHKELKSLVESIAWNELDTLKENPDEVVGYEALFVLVNYVSGGAKHMSEAFDKNLVNDDDLVSLFETCMVHRNKKVAAVAREGFDLISQMISTLYPEIKEPVEPQCEDESCEESDTETDTENDVQYEPVVTICEKPVPSASDLVLGERRGNESAAVRRVVSLLVNSPVGEWVEVPSDWTLTISDLTTLQHLGYTIKDGYVGINPEIYTEY